MYGRASAARWGASPTCTGPSRGGWTRWSSS